MFVFTTTYKNNEIKTQLYSSYPFKKESNQMIDYGYPHCGAMHCTTMWIP